MQRTRSSCVRKLAVVGESGKKNLEANEIGIVRYDYEEAIPINYCNDKSQESGD